VQNEGNLPLFHGNPPQFDPAGHALGQTAAPFGLGLALLDGRGRAATLVPAYPAHEQRLDDALEFRHGHHPGDLGPQALGIVPPGGDGAGTRHHGLEHRHVEVREQGHAAGGLGIGPGAGFLAEEKGGQLDQGLDGPASGRWGEGGSGRFQAPPVADVGIAHAVGKKRHHGQAFGFQGRDDGRFRGGVVVDPVVARKKHAHPGRVAKAPAGQIVRLPGIEAFPVREKRLGCPGVPQAFPGLAYGLGRVREIRSPGEALHGPQQGGEIVPAAVDHIVIAAAYHGQRHRGLGPQGRVVAQADDRYPVRHRGQERFDARPDRFARAVEDNRLGPGQARGHGRELLRVLVQGLGSEQVQRDLGNARGGPGQHGHVGLPENGGDTHGDSCWNGTGGLCWGCASGGLGSFRSLGSGGPCPPAAGGVPTTPTLPQYLNFISTM